MSEDNKLKVAIISSLTGGLGHYCAHLAEPLSQYAQLKFITYPQIDLSGTTVKQITDTFVRQQIKWPRFDLEENNPASIININEYLTKRELEVINIHVATTVKRKINYFTTFIMYAKKTNKKKFVFTLHDVLPFDEDKKMTKLLRMFYSLADHYTVGNIKEKGKLIRYFDVPEHKISVIPHGIYNLFDRNLYNKKIARGFLGIPEKAKILLFFGWMREYKGFDYLIKAAKMLTKKHNDFFVYVAAGTKYASPGLTEKYLRMIYKLDLQDRFILNLNYLSTADIEAVFKAADYTILPYTHASQSGVMMLSFGFKRPVVITETFADKEWVNKKCGLVAKTGDAQSLAEKIDEFIQDPVRAEQYGQYGYDYSMKHFNWQDIAKKYAEVYRKVKE